jgi:glycerol kinase
MQIQANLLEANVIRPQTTETTAIGAAFFAGLATGYWESIESLAEIWSIDQIFSPDSNLSNKKTIDLWNNRIGKLSNTNSSK